MKITDIAAQEIFDSRGIPTIECTIILENTTQITASVPSGMSCGMNEAVELRDGDDRLMGLGVRKAVNNINTLIKPLLINREPDIIKIDNDLIDLDGTDDKSHLGANAILAASIAVCKAHADNVSLALYELIAN